MDLLKHNREAWENEVKSGNKWTVPVTPAEIADARNGVARLMLTPTKPMPMSWFPDIRGKKVLCLASGGGQQGPLFAAMGAVVTVFDNCPAQLDRDAEVARREGLAIELVQGDMRDLSRFPDATFDFVFHPISNVFVDDVKRVWKEAFRVLKAGGSMAAGVMNPVVYLFDFDEMDRSGRLEVRYHIPYSDLEQLPADELKRRIEAKEPIEFGHSLTDQIGGQTDAGFHVIGFFEDLSGYDDPIDRHIPGYIATLAKKPACGHHR
jgi:SAM-dependent methyltransferase